MDEKLIKLIKDAYNSFSGEDLTTSEVAELVEAFEANGLEIIEIDQED